MNGNIITKAGLIMLGLLMVFSSVFACTENNDCEMWEICYNENCILGNNRCNGDGDCNDGEICFDTTHTCIEVECTEDSDCDGWQECDDNMCEPASGRCEYDFDCDDDEFCNGNHYCEHYECEINDDCSYWEICNDNECKPAKNRCGDDGDCDSDEMCFVDTHTCIPADYCLNNSDCPSGYFCNGNHQCQREDDDDDDDDDNDDDDDDDGKTGCRCKSSEVCINGECVTKEGWCDSASDCNPWEMCSGHECVIGPDRCATDEDCDTPGEECDLATYRCILAPGYCSNDRDCADWEVCDAGRCALGSGMCASDSDCDNDEFCNNETHTCEDKPVVFECDPVPTEDELCGPYMDIISELRSEKAGLEKALSEKEEEEEPILGGDFLFMLLGGIALLALGGLAGWHGNNHFGSVDDEEGEYESGGEGDGGAQEGSGESEGGEARE